MGRMTVATRAWAPTSKQRRLGLGRLDDALHCCDSGGGELAVAVAVVAPLAPGHAADTMSDEE